MHALGSIWTAMSGAAVAPFAPSGAYGAPALLGAFAFVALNYVIRRRSRGRKPSLMGFVRAVFPKRVLMHPSTLVDIRLWLLNGVVLAALFGALSGGLFFWRDATGAALAGALGAPKPISWPTPVVLLIATVVQVLAYELAYWLSHYALHRVPTLWEFHKVHHSAEVMTTFTELRQHPVEILLVVNSIGLATGFVFGIMTYLFGPDVRPFTLMSGNALFMLFLFTYGHLRHSSLWIPFTGPLARILHSPAHHQLHHSDNPIHYDKNLGFALSVWDWAFGTLVIPKRSREPVTFGIGEDAAPFRSVTGSWLTPFARCRDRIAALLPLRAIG